MGQKLINIRVEVDRDTDHEFEKWSESEGRSKRRHAAILMRKLTSLRKTRPDDLVKLGLIDPATVPAFT